MRLRQIFRFCFATQFDLLSGRYRNLRLVRILQPGIQSRQPVGSQTPPEFDRPIELCPIVDEQIPLR